MIAPAAAAATVSPCFAGLTTDEHCARNRVGKLHATKDIAYTAINCFSIYAPSTGGLLGCTTFATPVTGTNNGAVSQVTVSKKSDTTARHRKSIVVNVVGCFAGS